jgi:hypothetical protein
VKPDDVLTRSWHEGEQLRDELGRREDQRLGPVGPAPLELERDTAVRQRRQPLVGDGRAGEIARDVLQAFAIVGGDTDIGVEAEAVDLRAAAAQGHRLPRRPRPDEAPDPRAAPGAHGHDARHRRAREACEKRLVGDRRIVGHVIDTSEPPIDLAHDRRRDLATSSSVGAGTG